MGKVKSKSYNVITEKIIAFNTNSKQIYMFEEEKEMMEKRQSTKADWQMRQRLNNGHIKEILWPKSVQLHAYIVFFAISTNRKPIILQMIFYGGEKIPQKLNMDRFYMEWSEIKVILRN